MTLSFAVNGVTLPDEAVLINPGGVGSLPSSAWYGETATATIVVDDPFADYDFRSWEVFTADESAATGKTRVFTGWIFRARISRGTYRHGAARVWELEIVDQNAALGFNFFRANSAQRPAETDLARVEFILESEPMAWTPVVAGPLTNLTDNPRNLQSYDMVRTTPVEDLTTTAGHAGKSFHVFWSHDDAELQLYYDQIVNYPAATASISNDIADAGADVYYPFVDASLVRAGDQIYTGELIDFVGGSAFGENAATIDRLSPTPLSPIAFKRAFMRRSDAIGRLETANAIIQQDLTTQATEENTITVTIRVPAANVNDVEAGQRVAVKFTHLVGYETETTVNCIRRDVVPTDGRVDMYDITLELSDKAKLRELDGGDPDDLPTPPSCTSTFDIVDSGETQPSGGTGPVTFTLPWTPTEGNTLIIYGAHREVTTTIDTPDFSDIAGYVDAIAGDGFQQFRTWMRFRYVEAGDTDTYDADITNLSAGIFIDAVEIEGQIALDSYDTESVGNGVPGPPWSVEAGTVTPDADNVILIGGITGRNNVPTDNTITFTSGAVELEDQNSSFPMYLGYRKVPATGGTSWGVFGDITGGGTLRGYIGICAAFTCEGGDACPATGQWVEDETVTLTGADGTTRCPFADGSLHVFIDNVEQTATLAAQDGATGDFTLGFTPTPTEVCTVMYQGR